MAKALGGVRLPNIGRSQPDVRAPGIAAQVKTRTSLPEWLWSAMHQAERDAEPHENPVVVLAEVVPGKKTKRLVVMDFERFAALVAGPDPDQPLDVASDRSPGRQP